MNIKSVRIKNVRGLKDQTIHLNMLPNKPSLLVAPNGTGKSSFAIAFQSLTKKRLHVPEENVYQKDDRNIPVLVLETDDNNKYISDKSTDEISKYFDVYVINNQNKPKTTTQNINGIRIPKTRMTVEPIVLINDFPTDKAIPYTFIKDFHLENLVRGCIPSIKDVLSNNNYLVNFSEDDLQTYKRALKPIDEFLRRLKEYSGRKVDIWNKIETDDLSILQNIEIVSKRVDSIKKLYPTNNDCQIYLMAIQIVYTYIYHKAEFKNKILFAKRTKEYDSYKELFNSLNDTWKKIKPQKNGKLVYVEIPDTDTLSNGERDIIVFLSMLQRAKNALKKDNNILIIDEVFDYLDDANLVSAQYYITKFIEEYKKSSKNIFPIILTHLNPDYYNTFAFKKNKMKVYYLKPHTIPSASENMRKLIEKRKDYKDNADPISKYMLHFYDNFEQANSELNFIFSQLKSWKDIESFKSFCKEQTNIFLSENGQEYDSMAVCVWLRECIERYIYFQLPNEKRADLFSQKGTEKKIQYADDCGVDTPENFSLLRMIYNDSLHNNQPGEKDLRQTLYSRLENKTIKTMINSVVNLCSDTEIKA